MMESVPPAVKQDEKDATGKMPIPKKSPMLQKRLIASVFIILPVLTFFWLDATWNSGIPGIWSTPIIALFSLLVVGELIAMTRDHTPGVIPWVAYCGVLLCHVAVVLPKLFPDRLNCWALSSAVIFLTIAAAFVNELWLFHVDRRPTLRIALTVFVVLYAGWLLSFLVAMRLSLENYKGIVALFSVLFTIKMSDTGAYFVGKKFGKHKLAPVLSPGKTIEGLFGGLAAAIFAACLVFALLMPGVVVDYKPNWTAVLGYALTIAIVGVVGDLCESQIKRDMQCKDSSSWLPGLGGIMDTADSVLLAGPVAYLWWQTGLL